jgi:hypothetical protein
MFRLASVGAVLGTVLFLALLPLVAPLIETGFSLLPGWLSLTLLAAMGVWVLQAVATFVLGRGAAEHMAGTLAADLVRILVLALLFPFRLLWRVFWR